MQTLLVESAVRATLIAGVIALVLWIMRIRTASARHSIWAGVVAMMLLLPAWVAWGPKASLAVLPPDRNPAVARISLPIPAGQAGRSPTDSPRPVPGPVRQDRSYSAIYALYFFGAGVLLMRLAIGTIRANRLTSASCAVPITVGVLRPRIILPASSRDWPQAQLDVVLAHEGEHVRRRDPLFQWLALLNRAIFWFHPLAWWLERKLSGLAEEACDAAVVANGHDPQEYSVYLLNLARTVRRTGLRVGMAMPGVQLPRRIRRLLSGIPMPRTSRVRMACTVAACAGAAAIFASGTAGRGQSLPLATKPAPKWEVASIRSCTDFGTGERGANKTLTPNRMTLYCSVLQSLIVSAYLQFADGVEDRDPGLILAPPVENGPGWIDSERYTINAKSESDTSPGVMQGPMLQALLEDRFKLKAHFETKGDQPAYALTVAKGGPKLKPFVEGSCTWREKIMLTPQPGDCLRRNTFNGGKVVIDEQGITIEEFRYIYLRISPFNAIDGPVVDRTGLTGRYDIHLESVLSVPPGLRQGDDNNAPDGPTLFTALEDQLGLKLERIKAPKKFLVIDHIERPSEN